ncbi:MAG: GNAT family N-acetyltransferase [Anaerolineae bacterium]|nr:GNAT family N-acetyltransferase [Anaerolineae bacterium]
MAEWFDFQHFPVLETERLVLRELVETDAQALFEYFREPEYTRFVSFDIHTSIEQTRDFINFMTTIYQQKDSIRWGIELKSDKHLIGTAGLHFWKRNIRCAEVGYHIGQSYWRQGFATEVLEALVGFGFQHMNLNRIEGRHNAGNDASGRVMQKIGFQKEGIWRQREIKFGQFVDVVQFSLLREEYNASR